MSDDDCEKMLAAIDNFLDGVMAHDERDQFWEHVQGCLPCLDRYNLDAMVQTLLRRSCQCEPAPENLRTRIMVQITSWRSEGL